MTIQTFRAIDANCNRISEGLRFLEDISRFVLNDASLSKRFKEIRHKVINKTRKLGIVLISNRDSESDVGTASGLRNEAQNIPSLIAANAKRAEQGLRVIEELAKLPEVVPFLDHRVFETARFDLYTLEKQLLSLVLRNHKRSQLTGLYVILDSQILESLDMIGVATQVISGGAKILQLRDKHLPKGKLFTIAQRLKKLCQYTNTLFIINDHLDVALGVNADGLHIGQEDLPLSVARKLLPIDKIIGCSVDTIKQALKVEKDGADYIAVGAIYPTQTKHDAKIVGAERLSRIKQVVSIPVIAIGGINEDNVRNVISTHVDAVAVASAILKQKDIESSARRMVNKIGQKRRFSKQVRSPG
jgi:thiamine-phosphate pyrophosphorylase